MAAKYTYRKNEAYESSYEIVYRFSTIGDVERNLGPDGWYAELFDGRRGEGKTRDMAVTDALSQGKK